MQSLIQEMNMREEYSEVLLYLHLQPATIEYMKACEQSRIDDEI